MIYEVIEDFPIHDKITYKNGTIRKGLRFKVIREPNPKKKLYKLEQIDTKFPQLLYLRQSELNKYMKEIVSLKEV